MSTTRTARYARFVVDHPWAITLAFTLLTAWAAVVAARLTFETSPKIWFPHDDAAVGAYDEMSERLGGDRFALAIVDGGDEGVFRREALEAIDRLTRAFSDAPHVVRVQSPTTLEQLRGTADGALDVLDPLPEDALATLSPADLAAARARILGDPLAVGLVVDARGRSAAVVAELDPDAPSLDAARETTTALTATVEAERAASGLPILLVGGPILDVAMFHAALRDNSILLPVLYGFVIGALWVVVRRVRGTLLTALVVGVASATALALVVTHGSRLNNLTSMVPIILLAVSVANAVHVLEAFYSALTVHRDRRVAAAESIVETLRPCLFSSVTTAIGFASLASSGMPPLAEYGAVTAIGVLVSFATAASLLPALLSLGRLAPGAPTHQPGGDRLVRLLARVEALSERHGTAILVASAALTAVAIAGAARIRIETVALHMFSSSNPMRVATEAAERLFGGVMSFDVLVRTGRDGGVHEPRVIAALDALERHVAAYPEVTKTLSLVEPLDTMMRALDEGATAPLANAATITGRARRWPDGARGTAQVLLLYGLADPVDDLGTLIDFDRTRARVTARMPSISAERMDEIVRDVEAFLSTELPDLDAQPTGLMMLYNAMGTLVFDTFMVSFALALAIITAIICVSVRSLRLGLFSMVPNVLPIVWVLGVMGIAGIELNVGTALVASITLGIAVDDTIHFLTRYGAARQEGLGVRPAVHRVFVRAGRAIVATSVILASGFWTLGFAEFRPVADLGVIAGITVAFALAADLLLLPALLGVLDRSGNGDHVGELGDVGDAIAR